MTGLSRRFTPPMPGIWLAALVAAAVLVAGLGAVCVPERHWTGPQHAVQHATAGGAEPDIGAATALRAGFMQSADLPTGSPVKCCAEPRPEAISETPAHQQAGSGGSASPPPSARLASPGRTLHLAGQHCDARMAAPSPGDLSISRT